MKPKQKRIALIGLPILQPVNNLSNAAIACHAAETGRWNFVFSAEPSVDAFRFLRKLDCDGAIVRIITPAMKREAEKIRFPLVNISSWLENPGVPTVRHDFAVIGRQAAEHLLEKGFRRFGIVVTPGGYFLKQRYGAVQETIRARGLKPAIFSLRTRRPDSTEPLHLDERKRFVEWVRQLPPPAALILTDDWDAPELMLACREAGREIPRDLVMITTGCHSEVLPLCPVPLSAAQEDQENMAHAAIALLDYLMAGKRPAATNINIPPLPVAERASTATMAIDDREVAHAVEFIRAHAFEPINVADASSKLNISRVTLERRFRQVMKQTPHDYLIQQRVTRAKELLLAEPPQSLQAIARQCGIADRRRLNQIFKNATGKSPGAWQRAAPSRRDAK